MSAKGLALQHHDAIPESPRDAEDGSGGSAGARGEIGTVQGFSEYPQLNFAPMRLAATPRRAQASPAGIRGGNQQRPTERAGGGGQKGVWPFGIRRTGSRGRFPCEKTRLVFLWGTV